MPELQKPQLSRREIRRQRANESRQKLLESLGSMGVDPVSGSDLKFTSPTSQIGSQFNPEQLEGLRQTNSDDDLAWLIQKESGGRTTAKNPKSTAFGLGQLIEANRKNYAARFGFDPNTTDYDEQLTMMKAYIEDRYGTPAKAREFWEQHNWY